MKGVLVMSVDVIDINLKTNEEAAFIEETCQQMILQFKAKNVAYGDSFGKQFEKYGPVSALVRMSDKFSRIEALILGAENNVPDEKLEDTLIDMACYCLMTLYELKRYGNQKFSDKVRKKSTL